MKIVQINSLYKSGSTGKITFDLHTGLLEKGIESIVIYGRGEKSGDKKTYKVCGEMESHIWKLFTMFTGRIFGGCYEQTFKAIEIIKKEKPDIVHLQCINGYFINIYLLINWLKKNNIKTVLTLHAEFMYTGTCGHSFECEGWKTGCGKCPVYKKETKSFFIDSTHSSWMSMKKAFMDFENIKVISVSPWLMNRAKSSPILDGFPHSCVLNGLDTSIFHYYDDDFLYKKYENVIDFTRPIVFHATAFFDGSELHNKGGYYILKLAEQLPEYNFIIAGAHANIEAPPLNVIFLGNISNQSILARLYSIAACTVITSMRETFSMICAESLCCGTPVVGFLCGGLESISVNKYSFFCEHGDVNTLCNLTKEAVVNKNPMEISHSAQMIYSKEAMTNNYIKHYEELLREKK